MQSDAIKPGQSVIIVDDLVATGKWVVFFFKTSSSDLQLQGGLLKQLENLSPSLGGRPSSISSSSNLRSLKEYQS